MEVGKGALRSYRPTKLFILSGKQLVTECFELQSLDYS